MARNHFRLFVILALLTPVLSQAQVRFGLRAGINDVKNNTNPITLLNQIGEGLLKVGVDRTQIGYSGGLVVQGRIGAFLIQPEFILSSDTYRYDVVPLMDPVTDSDLAQEKYLYLNIPLLLGWKLGPLRLQAGPEAHIFLNSRSDLVDIQYYRENTENFTFGWLGNIGLDIWNIMLDFRYEGNLSRLGSSFQVGDTSFRFDERPARWVFSVGWLF